MECTRIPAVMSCTDLGLIIRTCGNGEAIRSELRVHPLLKICLLSASAHSTCAECLEGVRGTAIHKQEMWLQPLFDLRRSSRASHPLWTRLQGKK